MSKMSELAILLRKRHNWIFIAFTWLMGILIVTKSFCVGRGEVRQYSQFLMFIVDPSFSCHVHVKLTILHIDLCQ